MFVGRTREAHRTNFLCDCRSVDRKKTFRRALWDDLLRCFLVMDSRKLMSMCGKILRILEHRSQMFHRDNELTTMRGGRAQLPEDLHFSQRRNLNIFQTRLEALLALQSSIMSCIPPAFNALSSASSGHPHEPFHGKSQKLSGCWPRYGTHRKARPNHRPRKDPERIARRGELAM